MGDKNKEVTRERFDEVMSKLNSGARLGQEEVQDIIKFIGKQNVRFYLPMRQLHVIPFIGWEMKSSNGRTYLTECYLCESHYEVGVGYKLTLRACDQRYGSETFYTMDFAQMLGGDDPYIKLKMPGDRLVFVEGGYNEPIAGTGLSIRHEFSDFQIVNVA